MLAEEIILYCEQKKGVSGTFPFGPDTLVFKVGPKIFLLMALEQQPLTINVKTDPEQSIDLRARHWQITGAYHMNKTHWNSVVCEGLHQDFIKKLIDQSYDLVLKSLPKKIQKEITEN